MWLVFGLGNPGSKYQGTRHNFGFEVVDAFAKHHHLKFKFDPLTESEFAKFKDLAILVKPMTYMNLSGRAVKKWVSKTGIDVSRIFVVYDDMDLPLGKIKILPKGGSGGHKGVKSIIEALATKDFPRMKLGIGKPPEGMSVVDFVLSRFSPYEQDLVKKVVETALFAIDDLFTLGLEKVMTKYNTLRILD